MTKRLQNKYNSEEEGGVVYANASVTLVGRRFAPGLPKVSVSKLRVDSETSHNSSFFKNTGFSKLQEVTVIHDGHEA